MPAEGICKLEHEKVLRNEEILKIVDEMAKSGITKIRLTGGEPLVRRGIVDLIRGIKNTEGISEVTMTTNGYFLEGMLDDLVDAGLDRVNISIDSLDADRFESVTRGGKLEVVMSAIEAASHSELKKVKLNVVLIGGFNDDEIEDFVALTKNENIDVRFIELMPIGLAADWAKERFISNEIILERIKDLKPIDYFDVSSPARYYQKSGHLGLVGLINPVSCNFCSNCNRIRLTADGKIKPCLHSDDEIDLLDAIRNHPENIQEIIHQGIFSKPKEHHINELDFIPIKRDMNKIGG